MCEAFLCVLTSITFPWKEQLWPQVNHMLLIREDSTFIKLELLGQLVLRDRSCSDAGSSSERLRKPPETQVWVKSCGCPTRQNSGTFYYKLLFPIQYTYIQFLFFLCFFCRDWLVGWFGFVYLHLLGPWTYYFENSCLEAVEPCSSHAINSQFHILLALP